MSLVVVCGQPCSGKSTVAEKLADAFRAFGLEVVVVSEPSLHMIRNDSYKDVVSEKHTRGKLKSAVERALTKKNIVILDSLNNIKGYRYELWCVARSSSARYCMVHVDSPLERCREWNQGREGDAYSSDVFNDLSGRFERPDPRNRWDSPLFTVHPEVSPSIQASGASAATAMATLSLAASNQQQLGSTGQDSSTCTSATQQQASSNTAVHGGTAGTATPYLAAVPLEDADLDAPPEESPDLDSDPGEKEVLEAVIRAMTDSSSGASGAGPKGVARQAPLKPTFATNSTPMLGTNTLHEIDQAAQDIINAVNDAQSAAVGGAPGIVHFGEGLTALQMDQSVTLAELRRHKRAFLKLATKILFARLQDSHTAKRMFIDYLRDNVAGASLAPR